MQLPISHQSGILITTSIGALVGPLFLHLKIHSHLIQEVDLANLSNLQRSIILVRHTLVYLNQVPLAVALATTTITTGSMLVQLGLDVTTIPHPPALPVTLLLQAISGIMLHKPRKW